MSPAKKKEKLIQIDKDHFKKALAATNNSQKDIAEMLITSEQYLSRKLSQGIIDKDWLYKISDYLNVSRDYLSGQSDLMLSRLSEKRSELISTGTRKSLNDFMISRGFEEGFCNNLTENDLTNIELFIVQTVKSHENILESLINYSVDLEKRIQALEEGSQNAVSGSAERSDEKEAAPAKTRKKK